MTWVRIPDPFTESWEPHGADAGMLYLAGLCWSARNLSDGRIPRKTAPRLWPADDPAAVVAVLVTIGVWRDLGEAGYEIADWQDHLLPAEEVKAQRERKARNQAAYMARKRGGPRGDDLTTDQITDPVTDHVPHRTAPHRSEARGAGGAVGVAPGVATPDAPPVRRIYGPPPGVTPKITLGKGFEGRDVR